LHKQGKMAGFLADFGPDFLLPRAIKSTSIYRRWKRAIFLQWRKISALDSDGKDPNRWLKIGMVHCQIVKSVAAGCLSWPLWGGATSVYLPVSRWRPYPDVEGCLVISFVQVVANLVDVRYIKWSCKVSNRTSYFRELKKKMNSTRTLFLAKVHFSPSSFNCFQLNL
jgi:hypothetical protein